MPAPLSSAPPSGIALFDLDGTLIAWDCQLLFRHFMVRHARWRGVFLPFFLLLLPFSGLLGTARMKRVFLSYLWRITPEQLANHSQDFAQAIGPQIYPALQKEIDRHRAAGHFLILSSASPECYVTAIGRALGFDLSLGTPVETGAFFPILHNHKGAEKVVRLLDRLPPSYFDGGRLRKAHGYSDSCADLPMLALCESVTVVNPSSKLTAHAVRAGWEIVRPARPWKSRAGFIVRVLALLAGVGRDPGRAA